MYGMSQTKWNLGLNWIAIFKTFKQWFSRFEIEKNRNGECFRWKCVYVSDGVVVAVAVMPIEFGHESVYENSMKTSWG